MSSRLSRRALGYGLAALALAAPAEGAARAAGPKPRLGPPLGPADEAGWARVAALFAKPGDAIHLEHGNFGQVARPVAQAYARYLARQHRDTAIHARLAAGEDLARARMVAARALGCAPEELAFTRNATEAMQALIGGYHRLAPGDAVLIHDLDYPSMQSAMRWLGRRRGVRLVEAAIPETVDARALVAHYQRLIDADPAIRLLLLTQVSHRTGLVQPVSEIVGMARARGVDVLVDAAHAWGQLPFDLGRLGADFVGLNAHKWIGNPLGVGLVYIRSGRLDAIEPFMGNADRGTMSRVQPGTMNLAALAALPHALAWHDAVPVDARAARLGYLRQRWMAAIEELGWARPIVYGGAEQLAAIGALRLAADPSMAAHERLARALWDQHRIMTVARDGPAAGAVLRITPAPHTPARHVDRLVAALRAMSPA